jgi:hypothetical protein
VNNTDFKNYPLICEIIPFIITIVEEISGPVDSKNEVIIDGRGYTFSVARDLYK